MRHRKRRGGLSRTSSHRLALKRNLTRALFEHERIITTPAKAKRVRPFAERLITMARAKDLARVRRAARLLPDKGLLRKLFDEIGPRFVDRNGGYTRILRHPGRRLGDNSDLVILELVGAAVTAGEPAGGQDAEEDASDKGE